MEVDQLPFSECSSLLLQAKFLKFLHTQYPDVFAAQGDRVRVVFRYLDESGDQCILSSQAEWDALLLNPVIGPIIRLSIEFCGTVSIHSP